MKITLATTVWNRMDITRPVLSYYGGLDPEGVSLRRVAVCSSHDEGEAVEGVDGWTATYYPNDPLTEKHDAVVQRARRENPDAVCVVNSDDLISEAYLEAAAAALSDGVDVVRLLSAVVVDTTTGRGAFSPQAFPMSGVVLSADVLNDLDWRPWQGSPMNKYLDNRLAYNLERLAPNASAFQHTPATPIQFCMLKSEQQIWSYDEHLGEIDHGGNEPADIDADDYLDTHFPSVKHLLPNAEVQ